MRATLIKKVFDIGLEYGATLFRPMSHGSQTGVALIICEGIKKSLMRATLSEKVFGIGLEYDGEHFKGWYTF